MPVIRSCPFCRKGFLKSTMPQIVPLPNHKKRSKILEKSQVPGRISIRNANTIPSRGLFLLIHTDALQRRRLFDTLGISYQ